MSTAVAESVIEKPVETAAVVPEVKAEKAPLTFKSFTDLISTTPHGKPKPKVDPKAEVKPPAVVTPEVKKPDSVTTPDSKDTSKEANLARLREAKEKLESDHKAATEELAKLRAEAESLRGRPDPESVNKERQALEAQLQEVKQNLKSAALQRDPDFLEKYDKRIEGGMQQMVKFAMDHGVEKSEAVRAVQNMDSAAFSEWAAAMPVYQQGKFIQLATTTESLFAERNTELAQADKRYEENQTARQRQFEQTFQAEADGVVKEIFADETLAKDEELKATVASEIRRATMLHSEKYTRAQVLQRVAHAAILSKIAVAQQASIEELRGQSAEKDKKIEELEEFVAEHSKGVPRAGNSTGAAALDKGKYVPIWNRLVIR